MDKHISPQHPGLPVRKAFSKSAHRYDQHAEIQEHVAMQLLSQIPKHRHTTHLLDIGMGTGRMTHVLTKLFPQAQVVGIDFAEGMVREAHRRHRSYHVIQADARQLPFKSAKFDLVVSNLAYQWVEDLGGAFAQAREVMAGGGTFVGTLFGRHSLRELFDSLEYGGAKNFFPRRLPTLHDVEKNLQASHWHIRKVHSQQLIFDFHGMWDLMVWLKNIGANAIPRRGYLGKKILMKANQYYYEHYKTPAGIAATFELIWFEVKR